MATSLKQIQGYLEEGGLKCQLSEEKGGFLRSLVRTRVYRAPNGDEGVVLICRADENGEVLSMFTPGLYFHKDGQNAFAVLGACLHASFVTKFVQYVWDPSDGEIRAEIEVPIEDSQLTSRQFHRCVSSLLGIIDACDPMIRGAMSTGKIVPPSFEEPAPTPPAMEELMRLLGSVDPEKLRKLLEEAGARPEGPSAL